MLQLPNGLRHVEMGIVLRFCCRFMCFSWIMWQFLGIVSGMPCLHSCVSSATKQVQDGLQDQSQLGQCCSLSGHGKFDLFLATRWMIATKQREDGGDFWHECRGPVKRSGYIWLPHQGLIQYISLPSLPCVFVSFLRNLRSFGWSYGQY
jgi:hypothetical protein